MAFLNPKTAVAGMGFREGMKVADFGAGSGEYAFALARMVRESGEVYALDVQKEIVHHIADRVRQEGFENLKVIWGDVEKEGGSHLPDASMDGVLLSNILNQSSERPTLMREAKRVLKKGGRVVLIDWSDSFGGLGPHPSDVVTTGSARRIAEEAGLVFEREIPAGDHHWGAVFKSP